MVHVDDADRQRSAMTAPAGKFPFDLLVVGSILQFAVAAADRAKRTVSATDSGLPPSPVTMCLYLPQDALP